MVKPEAARLNKFCSTREAVMKTHGVFQELFGTIVMKGRPPSTWSSAIEAANLNRSAALRRVRLNKKSSAPRVSGGMLIRGDILDPPIACLLDKECHARMDEECHARRSSSMRVLSHTERSQVRSSITNDASARPKWRFTAQASISPHTFIGLNSTSVVTACTLRFKAHVYRSSIVIILRKLRTFVSPVHCMTSHSLLLRSVTTRHGRRRSW